MFQDLLRSTKKKQIEVLHNIGSNHLENRMPMLVIDSNKIYKDKLFS